VRIGSNGGGSGEDSSNAALLYPTSRLSSPTREASFAVPESRSSAFESGVLFWLPLRLPSRSACSLRGDRGQGVHGWSVVTMREGVSSRGSMGVSK